MVFPIRQGATHKIPIGIFVAVGDGFVPVTNFDISTADTAYAILHDNATAIDISGYALTAIANVSGQYHLTLQSAISNTVGMLRIAITDNDVSLTVQGDFQVLDTAAYDAMYKDGAEGPLQATTVGRKLDVTAGGAAGIDWANVENKGSTVDLSDTSTKLVDTTTANSDMRGTDNAADLTDQATMQTAIDAIPTTAMRGTDGVDTATMRGTDNAATENKQDAQDLIITEARLNELDAGNLPGDVDAIKAKTDNQPAGVPKNVTLSPQFLMVDATDFATAKTGLSPTTQVDLDGAGFSATTNSATEIGLGVYKVVLTQAEMNADVITLVATGTGAAQTTIVILTSA